jgi:hypothetical protein
LIRIARYPIHLRWELYPVPGEKGKSEYGGSKLEDSEHWTKTYTKDRWGELKEMLNEIFKLKSVKENNPKIHSASFLLHWGLYLQIAGMVLILISVFLVIGGVSAFSDTIRWYFESVRFIIILASVIGLMGSIKMFYLRLSDPGLKLYSSFGHYFNIALIGSIFLSNIIWITTDIFVFGHMFTYYYSIVTFSHYYGLDLFSVALPLPIIGYINISIILLFLIYLPFTHMTHFFTKYFTYHKVRWDDEENLKGSEISKKIAKQLNQPVSWAASHIGADGKKNWIALVKDTKAKENNNE